MMRILVAVDDSPAGLAAARTAILLARESSGSVRAVYVQRPTGAAEGASAEVSQRQAPVPVLAYVSGLAGRAGIVIQTLMVTGQPARSILEQAATWSADFIVLGRSGVRRVGQPFLGSCVLHVLEFADVPVVIVPARD